MEKYKLFDNHFAKEGAKLAKLFITNENDNKIELVRDFSKNENAIWVLMINRQEIVETFSRLENCCIYLEKFNYYPEISKTEHMRFIISAYLNTCYILEARVVKFGNIIQKFLKSCQDEELKQLLNQMVDSIKKIKRGLKGIINTRSNDVHVEKYDTNVFNEVSSEEYIIDMTKTDGYTTYIDSRIKDLQNNYLAAFKKNNIEIRKLLNQYFGNIDDILFKNNYIKKVETNQKFFYKK